MNPDDTSNKETNPQFDAQGSDDAETDEKNRIFAQDLDDLDDPEDNFWWLRSDSDEAPVNTLRWNSQQDDGMNIIMQERSDQQAIGSDMGCQAAQFSKSFPNDASRNQTSTCEKDDSTDHRQRMNTANFSRERNEGQKRKPSIHNEPQEEGKNVVPQSKRRRRETETEFERLLAHWTDSPEMEDAPLFHDNIESSQTSDREHEEPLSHCQGKIAVDLCEKRNEGQKRKPSIHDEQAEKTNMIPQSKKCRQEAASKLDGSTVQPSHFRAKDGSQRCHNHLQLPQSSNNVSRNQMSRCRDRISVNSSSRNDNRSRRAIPSYSNHTEEKVLAPGNVETQQEIIQNSGNPSNRANHQRKSNRSKKRTYVSSTDQNGIFPVSERKQQRRTTHISNTSRHSNQTGQVSNERDERRNQDLNPIEQFSETNTQKFQNVRPEANILSRDQSNQLTDDSQERASPVNYSNFWDPSDDMDTQDASETDAMNVEQNHTEQIDQHQFTARQQQSMYIGQCPARIPHAVSFRVLPGVEYVQIPIMATWSSIRPQINSPYLSASFNNTNAGFRQSQQFQHSTNWQAASQNIVTDTRINRMAQGPHAEYIQGVANPVENVRTREEHFHVPQFPQNQCAYGQQHPARQNPQQLCRTNAEMINEQINDSQNARAERQVEDFTKLKRR